MHNTEIIERLLIQLNTPISLGVLIRLRYAETHGFDDMPSLDPSNYLDASSYLDDSQAVALLSKNENFKVKGRDTEKVCLETFLACENKNKLTNIRFRSNDFSFEKSRAVLFTARNIIAKILGKFSYSDPDFGPGSTFSLTGLDSNIITKLGSRLDCTPHCYSEGIRLILDRMPLFSISCGLITRDKGSVTLNKHEVKIVNSDRFTTVPKNWKTDRPIAIQPITNMLVQKAIAKTIRRRLKRAGLDLDNASSLHKDLAYVGSIYGQLSTIDFRSASDTISYELVKALLPEEWFDKLNMARTRKTSFDKNIASKLGFDSITLEKFSAMGNGYTFELESLLFFGVALAVSHLYGSDKDTISVFGDDVVIDTYLAEVFSKTMSDFGLEVNLEKSFTTGPFRESCGGDYYQGFSVRPIYLRKYNEKIDGNIYLCNRIRDIASVLCFNVILDKRFKPIWNTVFKRIPDDFKCFGPKVLGDQVLTGTGGSRERHSIRRYRVVLKKSRYFKRMTSGHHGLACALYGVPSQGVIPRGAKYRLVVRTIECAVEDDTLLWV